MAIASAAMNWMPAAITNARTVDRVIAHARS
jgi:hypothetical protein